MKRSIFFSMSITCLLLHLSAIAMQLPQEATQNSRGTNIRVMENENLYVVQIDQQLYLGMERVYPNTRRLLEWSDYANRQLAMGKDLKINTDGFDHFVQAVNGYISQSIFPSNELWILFASNQPIVGMIDLPQIYQSIEMFCSVITSPNARLTSHLGISRSCESLQKAPIRRPFPMSIYLHALGAKIMRMRDPKKVALITVPVKLMLGILGKFVPQEGIFVAENTDLCDTLEKGFRSLNLGNAQELIGGSLAVDHQWLLTDPYQPVESIRPYTMINLEILARLLA